MTRETATGGRGEGKYYPAIIETARVMNVNLRDWTVDCSTEYAGKRLFDIQWMCPYLHFTGGEGIYFVPEPGAVCWVAQESTGLWAQTFVLGFQAPIDSRPDKDTGLADANFRANRQTFNLGDIILRGRDENFVMLRRGGVVQVGSGPATQRLYIPIQGIIRDVCQNHQIETLSGDMEWMVERTDQDDAGQVHTHFRLRSKAKASDPEHAVILTTGSQSASPDVRLSLVVNETGETGAPVRITMEMNKDGDVKWELERDWILNAGRDITMVAQNAATLRSVDAKLLLKSDTNEVDIQAGAKAKITAQQGVDVTAQQGTDINLSATKIVHTGQNLVGGAGANQSLMRGDLWKDFMTLLLAQLANAGVVQGAVAKFPGVVPLQNMLQGILSENKTT